MRAPIVVRPEVEFPVIVRALFVIPAQRVTPGFRGVSVEANAREVPPGRLNPRRGCAGALVRYHQHVKAGFAKRRLAGIDVDGNARDIERELRSLSLGNAFKDACVTAGILDKSAHGLRKAAATRAADNGAIAHELMAIFGWKDIKEAEIYTKAADRKRLRFSSSSVNDFRIIGNPSRRRFRPDNCKTFSPGRRRVARSANS
ncbi:tyrosine-type recombinase/integrase [Bradyrhizobium tropiciagri]|uniref:tyrosine-type recombinase/integrase n=1 Tax=Bradyrhizobium tropiciagri TaxID=312253 RepID=UPI003D9B940A